MKIELTRSNCIIDGVDFGAIARYQKVIAGESIRFLEISFVNKFNETTKNYLRKLKREYFIFEGDRVISLCCSESEITEYNPDKSEIIEFEMKTR